MIVLDSDFRKIIKNTNRIDMMLDQFRNKIPYAVWTILIDLNTERAGVFEKYMTNWDEIE